VRSTGSAIVPRKPFAWQTRTLLWVGFGGLLLLMGVLGLSAVSFLYQIEIRQEKIRQDFVERDRTLETLRADTFVSGTYIRDFLLDTNAAIAAKHRRQFLDAEQKIESSVSEYRGLLRPNEKETFERLRDELETYFNTVKPALTWSATERQAKGPSLVQEEVLPRRFMAVGLADRIQQMSEKELEIGSQEISGLFESYRAKLLALLMLTIAIGVALAGAVLWRLLKLENESEIRFRQVLNAREELKRLSAELVSAQEEERRRISRELHDEVGQVLAAVMLSLGNLKSSVKTGKVEEAARELQMLQDMTEQNARVVRNLSLLLRPAMLDDLGLIPALKWLAREVSRTTPLQVDVSAEGCPEDLPEEHRTCIYRVAQEAVRNACRHAGARHARIYVELSGRSIRTSVQDDGKGFTPAEEAGAGILGMHERVQRLGGTLKIDSEAGRGTLVSFVLPMPEEITRAHSRQSAQETSPFRTA